MKKSTRLIGLMMVLAMLVTMLAACGGGRADAEYEGKYIAVAGEMLGMALTGEDMAGIDIELLPKGKVKLNVEGESGSGKWTNDDTSITIKVDGTEMVGTLGTDIIEMDNMLDMGMKVTFAKEGTAAANAENYLPEDEKKLIGTWKSYAVTNALDEDASSEIAPDALTIEFMGDKNATLYLDGENLGTFPWSMFGGFGSFDVEETFFTWEYVGEELEATYFDDDYYFAFTCKKQ